MKKGLLIVISGPSGSGKGTVNAKLLESDDYVLSVSMTTRAPRENEIPGVSYHYISFEEFEGYIKNGEMLEHAMYCEHHYGTPRKAAMDVLESGKNLILEIEVEGALKVKKAYPDAVLIMLLPPSFSIQEARLRGRGTEDEEKVQKRLARTREELRVLSQYDYIVYNRDGGVDDCVEDIRAIVRAEQRAKNGNNSGDEDACAVARAEQCASKHHPDAYEKYFQ